MTDNVQILDVTGNPEGIPSCATCALAMPVPEHDGGAERNIYCRAVNYSEFPQGLKIRRTEFCNLWQPDKITEECTPRRVLAEAKRRLKKFAPDTPKVRATPKGKAEGAMVAEFLNRVGRIATKFSREVMREARKD